MLQDEAAAVAYALAVLDAAEAADHDAAVGLEMQAAGTGDDGVAIIIPELRRARKLRPTGTTLELRPGISHRDRRGFLNLIVAGEPIGQWDVGPAREHAFSVLQAMMARDSDERYARVLTEVVGMDPQAAAVVVAEVQKFRDDQLAPR